ncbi:MAG: hypothetical protein MIO93_10140 [ANME-2 cluster archaeon]|jgi:hypothetical protein|nr:hypothetical protein [ANME-2 cluster archaeon]
MIPHKSGMLKNCDGQMYTLEGAASAIMMVVLISFIVQASPLTPLTSSSSHQQVETQIEIMGNDLMIVLDYVPDGDTYSPLKLALLNWTGVEFRGQSSLYPLTVLELSETFDAVLLTDGIAYNFEVFYFDNNNKWINKRIFWNGRPSDNAIFVSKKIVIHDGDKIQASIIPDISSDTDFYNILDLRLTLWRM